MAGSLRGALAGLGVGLLLALAFGLAVGLTLDWQAVPRGALVFLLIFGPTLALIGALLAGLRGTLLETRTQPNQGMWLSARNALLVGLAVGLAGGLGEGLLNLLVGWLFRASTAGLATVLIAGLFWVIVAVLWYGGLDLIKHVTLRAILWLGGRMPWRYARFLDYGVDRGFLQRAGGGYLFANRLLQKHFAGLDIGPPGALSSSAAPDE